MSDAVITERELDADPSKVWEAISEPDRLGEWLGGNVDVDIGEGNEGSIVFDDGSEPAIVLIETVEEGERLVFRWATSVDAPTEVSIQIKEISTGTLIRIQERVLAEGEASRHVAQARACGSVRTLAFSA